jgi:type VI secretion system protein ImpL
MQPSSTAEAIDMLTNQWFLAALVLLIVVVLVVLVTVVYFGLRRSEAKPGSDPKLVKLRFDSLRSSFKQAVELIEANIVARSERYSIPWVLVLNESQTVRYLPLVQSGIASALSSESASAAGAHGISWNFFDKGIVIDMQGAYLGSPDAEDSSERSWDEFLGLCRSYRPQRPFDSLVVTVPVGLLLDTSSDATLELTKLARQAHRRLWLAQNRFAMRFAVYIVVSECERIEGFVPFARALPDSMRSGMLGWSSPYDLSTTYQSEWVADAVASMVGAVTDTSAELFALDADKSAVARFFLLPSRIGALASQLQVYVDELMRPSAYHEPFFFRGIYLTGDSGDTALINKGEFAADDGMEVSSVPALTSHLRQEPAFLRDLFEQKIFLEYGLARPSRQQLTRPLVSNLGRWTAGVLLGGWAIGLVVATFQLQHRKPEVVRVITQIESDANYRARAAQLNETIPPAWYRAKTLALLAEVERLVLERAWTFLMPGAWPIFDDLGDRVADRIERELGEIAITTIRKEIYTRVANMTEVDQDPSTSELIIGAECSAPAGYQAAARAPHRETLAVEDTREFAAHLEYLTSLDRLDQALSAMERLQKTDANANEDLRLLVKYALGTEITGNFSQSMRFLRGRDQNGSTRTAMFNVMHIRQAVRCSLLQGTNLLNQRIFLNNDLLVTERLLAAQSASVFAVESKPRGFAQSIASFREIHAAIKEQEALLTSGKGGWMHRSELSLGKAYDAAMARVSQSSRLLGPEVAEQVQNNAVASFQKMRAEFDERFGPQSQGGVVWIDKEMRYALSPDRISLRDALASLLSQSFMVSSSGRELPAVVPQGGLSWDASKLDQALKLADIHKAYLAEGLPKFPAAQRPGVTAFINHHFAALINDAVLVALTITGRTDGGAKPEAAAFEASRARLGKVQEVLLDLGAADRAANLRDLIAQDATQRLKQLEDRLAQMDLYAIRGRDFKGWMGEKGPALQAFAVPDGPSLLQYLATQMARIETLGQQADIYLAAFGGGPAESQLSKRWQGINRELDRYRSKNPNSSLVLLEQFVMTTGLEADRSTCVDKMVGKGPAARSTDYFAERHGAIYSALQRRCTELNSTEQQELWASFAGVFNRSAAGRYPFSLLNARETPDADYEELGNVLKSFERLPRVWNRETNLASKRNGQAFLVQRFYDHFDKVRSFLLPLYPADESAIPGYDLMAEFRVNQSAELDGSKVIDWTLEVGSQTLKLRDAQRPLRWEPGASVVLTLRLAKDSEAIAVPDPLQPYMSTDGKTVTYRFVDTWALLRFINRQRDADTSPRADARSQLLRMEFPLSGQETRLRVYMRLAVMPVGKRAPLAWPSAFPVRAPELSSP